MIVKGRILKLVKTLVILAVLIYAGACVWFYQKQNSFIFLNPVQLDRDYTFDFQVPFESIELTSHDGTMLSAILFKTKAERASGVIFLLPGGGGNISRKEKAAQLYMTPKYDYFVMDYRGYGKSEGSPQNEKQMFADVQLAYEELLRLGYTEENILLIGHSLGTGPASYLAAHNNPRHLILLSPYYSLPDLMRHLPFPKLKFIKILPSWLLKFKFSTFRHIQACNMPITLIHGTDDKLIYYGSSLKLQQHLKPADTLITIPGENHNHLAQNPMNIENIKRIISSAH